MAIINPASPEGLSNAASMAQTPMNDVFLSTLALPHLNGEVSPAESTSGVTSGANSSRISAEIAEDPAAEAAASEEPAFALDNDQL